MVKECFRCRELKPIDAFYRHPTMADGRLGKCKECTKADSTANRKDNLPQVQDYDRKRAKGPHRKAQEADRQRRQRRDHPEKNAARCAIRRAIRNGNLVRPEVCQRCGGLAPEAHHAAYRRQLDVDWLCFKCHRETHGQTIISKARDESAIAGERK